MKEAAPLTRTKGRPRSGSITSTTERVKLLDEELIANGGRILNRLRLSPAAAKALTSLRDVHDSDRSAIEEALIHFEKRKKK